VFFKYKIFKIGSILFNKYYLNGISFLGDKTNFILMKKRKTGFSESKKKLF